MFWDFLSLTPESVHQACGRVSASDQNTCAGHHLVLEPRHARCPLNAIGADDRLNDRQGYRHMNGYSSHTLKLVNKEGGISWVKFHFKTAQVPCKSPTQR